MAELDGIFNSLKENPLIWFLSVLLAAFTAGYAVGYWARGILEARTKQEPKSGVGLPKKKEVLLLDRAIRNHFESQSWLNASPGEVMAEAKAIVRRFRDEVNVIGATEAKIEEMKRTEPNWSNANRLRDGLNLVRVLGLSEDTEMKNEIFIEMTMPAISPKDIPKSKTR